MAITALLAVPVVGKEAVCIVVTLPLALDREPQQWHSAKQPEHYLQVAEEAALITPQVLVLRVVQAALMVLMATHMGQAHQEHLQRWEEPVVQAAAAKAALLRRTCIPAALAQQIQVAVVVVHQHTALVALMVAPAAPAS